MGFDDVRDPYACLLGRLEILIYILLWIHHSCAAFAPSPKEVRGTPGLWSKKLSKNHLSSLLSSFRQKSLGYGLRSNYCQYPH